MDSAKMQDYRVSELGIQQSQDLLAELKRTDTKGYFKDSTPLTKQEVKGYAKSLQNLRIFDVELADGRKVSVEGTVDTTEIEAIELAYTFFNS